MSQCKKRVTKGCEIRKAYEPTPRERDAIDAFNARRKGLPPSPGLKASKTGDATTIFPDHQDLLTGQIILMHVLGTTDVNFMRGLLGQLANVASSDLDSALNFMLAVVKGIEPKDQLETMLGAQMAAVHMATMTFASRLGRVETISQQDSAERAFNKLARTFAMQMEALKRYRTGGQQRLTVEHVTVNQGGQAIVGSVTQRGAGDEKNKGSTS